MPRSVVEPDIVVQCGRSKIRVRVCSEGAVCCEVLGGGSSWTISSPSFVQNLRLFCNTVDASETVSRPASVAQGSLFSPLAGASGDKTRDT